MDAFFRTHTYLVEHVNAPVRRCLMDEINWNDRLIGIKGTRGVGKTTFLLQYAKERYGSTDRQCLYVNMNNFYFQGRGIADFAGEFCRKGGKVLLIDQVFKQPDWSRELRRCYDNYPQLQIVFTGSSVMRLKEENPELQPPGILFPGIPEPADRTAVRALHAEGHSGPSRRDYPCHPVQGKSDETLSGLYPSWLLSFLPGTSELFRKPVEDDEHDDGS